MEKYRKILLTAVIFVLMGMIASAKGFVTVSDGRFILDGKPYKYVGTNMWQATIMASEGRGGNRAKLLRELDHLKRVGISNVRILVGAEGPEGLNSHIKPVLQTAPGVYNDTILQGLDLLLVEMEKRDLRGVFYLTNSWEWSGGYSAYLQWAGFGDAKIPRVDGYDAYVDYVKHFVSSDSAKAMYYRHIRRIVGRTNSITGKPYSESAAIMSWQIANEPRPFSKDGLPAFCEFLLTSARIIKSIDSNHLVSTGSEGLVGFEMNLEWWTKLHSAPEIDYANIHIWPCTWRWVTRENVFTAVDKACADSRNYIKEHYDAISPYGKPLVLEEFGYHRDAFSFTPGSPTKARDQYYKYILDILTDTPMLAGCNFWAWSGDARPSNLWWQEWDDFCGDPAQEEQGLYSVFSADKSTLKIIKKATARLR
ncbi:MAG: beta-mannosidase [Bacteroidales bacterium]|nr:beta-mannosidase [Bacteroidales bacterium]